MKRVGAPVVKICRYCDSGVRLEKGKDAIEIERSSTVVQKAIVEYRIPDAKFAANA